MGFISKIRARAGVALAIFFTGALTLTLPTPAEASPLAPAWALMFCSSANYDTAYYLNGTYQTTVARNTCQTHRWQPTSAPSMTVKVEAAIPGKGYFGATTVDIKKGAGLQSAGDAGSPFLFAF
ncbi:hypothetical protein [Actinacidiphila glaucinigra]|uniref:hypothetical protein n=1 Tax=Actinacidiphila glaucinigra TaxID=235986 RepID=UPI0035E24595